MRLKFVWLVRNPDPLVLADDPVFLADEDPEARRINEFCSEVGVENEALFRVYLGTSDAKDPYRWENEKTTLYTEEEEAKVDARKRLAALRRKYTGAKCPTCKGRGIVGDIPHGAWEVCSACRGGGHVPRTV